MPDGQPTYQTYGANTPQCDGTGSFWVDLSLRNVERYRVRHLRIDCRKASTSYVLYGTENRLPANRWLCIEMKVQLNTPGKRDGELRVWLDGTEVFRHPRMWYRTVDSVKIRSVHDQFKSNRLYFKSGGHFWVDSIVVARSYIGPAVDTVLRSAPPTLFPAPPAARTSPVRKSGPRGIAASYPDDVGIEKDPDVIFVEDFEGAGWHGKWQERSGAHRKYGSLETDRQIALSGSNSLKLLFVPEAGRGGAGWMHHWWEGSNVAYLRYYFRLSEGGDWGNQKIMQLHGHRRGVRYGGGAGNRGIDWLCAGDGVGGRDGPPWRRTILYNYHPHQAGGFGDSLGPTVPDPPPAEEGRWICREIMIKLNDPGKLNGEVRKWIDGKLVIEKTDMEWRLQPDIVVNNIMQPTYTHKPPKPGKRRILWLDNIVLAKRYIGPMRAKSGRPENRPTAHDAQSKPDKADSSGGVGVSAIRISPLLRTGGDTGEPPWQGGGYFTVNYPEHLEFGPVGHGITRYHDPRPSAWAVERDGKLAHYRVASMSKRGVPGVTVASRVEVVGRSKLAFSLQIVNGSKRTLENVKPLLCFQYSHLAGFPGHLGNNSKHTYVVMDGKTTALADIPTAKAGSRVKGAFVKGVKPYRYGFARKHGGYIDKPLDLALSVITSQDGRRALILYAPVGRSMLSNRSIPGLHADPRFGHIKPGQSVQRRQYVIFAREDWRDEVRKIVASHKQPSSR